MKIKKRLVALALMIGWDFGLHLTDIFNSCKYWICPYKIEELLGFEKWEVFYWGSPFYNWFWSLFWGIALLIVLSLIIGENERRKNN